MGGVKFAFRAAELPGRGEGGGSLFKGKLVWRSFKVER
jgi:hypothetical protein